MTYTEHFQKIVEDQLARVEKLKNSSPVPDFAAKEKIIIGTIDGDGIGPVIMDSCRTILEKLLADVLVHPAHNTREYLLSRLPAKTEEL